MEWLQYLSYVLRHRWYVGRACWRCGLWRAGITHDLSKYLPSEFFPYASFFYGKKVRDSTGYYKPTDTGDKAFDFAWLLHQKRNRHHWQFWILPEDEGGVKLLPIPRKALLEMACDWWGAGKAQTGRGDFEGWYAANGHKIQMDADSRVMLENEIMPFVRKRMGDEP